MKSTELRSGNYINSLFGGIQQVVDVMCDGINTLKFEGINYDWIQPIPLTEEWLLKFGFKKVSLNYELNSFILWWSSYENCFVFRHMNIGEDIERKIYIDFVHTLQNLYFALTGEELTLKNEDK